LQVGFGSGAIFTQLLTYVDGTVPATPTIARIGLLQDWSFDISWDVKEGYGTYDMPAVVARGKAKVPIKMKMLELNSNVFENILFGVSGQLVTGETLMADQESHTPTAAIVTANTAAITSGAKALTMSGSTTGMAIGMLISIAGAGAGAAALVTTLESGSGTSWTVKDAAGTTVTTAAVTFFPTVTIAPPNSGAFVNDWGVQFSATGLTLSRLGTSASGVAPTTGQYVYSSTISANTVYNFATADAALVMLISYEYTLTSGYTMSVTRQLLGNLPTFQLFGKILFNGKQFTAKFPNVVATKLAMATKLDDFTYPEIDASAFVSTSGQIMSLSMVEL
jgi:hypothetical protein